MPTSDNSYSAKITQLRAQTLAAFHRANPNTQDLKNAGYPQQERVTRVVGQQKVILSNTVINECCKPCDTIGNFSVTQTNPGGDIMDGLWIFYITWTPAAGATSYTVSSNYPGVSVALTGPTAATVTVPDEGGSISLPITVTAINSCSSLPKAFNCDGCFLAGALVTMRDGSQKPIEDIRVGEWVLSPFGEHNEVLALHRPILGNGGMACINGEHHTTDHHPHVSIDKKFYVPVVGIIDANVYGRSHPVLDASNTIVERFLHGLKAERMSQLTEGVELKTVDGSKVVNTISIYSLPPETQLYNLVVGGSHTFCVDGYGVTGWPSEEDFNYDRWVAPLPPAITTETHPNIASRLLPK